MRLERVDVAEEGRLVGGQRVDDLVRAARTSRSLAEDLHQLGERTQPGIARASGSSRVSARYSLPGSSTIAARSLTRSWRYAEVLVPPASRGLTPTGDRRGPPDTADSEPAHDLGSTVPPAARRRRRARDCTTNPGMPHTTLEASSCTITRAPPACELLGTAQPVAAHAGHHDAERVGAVAPRRPSGTAGRRMGGRSSRAGPTSVRIRTSRSGALHRHVAVAGREPRPAGVQDLAVGGLHHPQRRSCGPDARPGSA